MPSTHSARLTRDQIIGRVEAAGALLRSLMDEPYTEDVAEMVDLAVRQVDLLVEALEDED